MCECVCDDDEGGSLGGRGRPIFSSASRKSMNMCPSLLRVDVNLRSVGCPSEPDTREQLSSTIEFAGHGDEETRAQHRDRNRNSSCGRFLIPARPRQRKKIMKQKLGDSKSKENLPSAHLQMMHASTREDHNKKKKHLRNSMTTATGKNKKRLVTEEKRKETKHKNAARGEKCIQWRTTSSASGASLSLLLPCLRDDSCTTTTSACRRRDQNNKARRRLVLGRGE